MLVMVLGGIFHKTYEKDKVTYNKIENQKLNLTQHISDCYSILTD